MSTSTGRIGEWCYFNGVGPRWEFFSDWKRYGFRVAWSNLRFNLGYWIGGFSHAER